MESREGTQWDLMSVLNLLLSSLYLLCADRL